jgi:phosphoglycerate dehydrogenase-like enzyme
VLLHLGGDVATRVATAVPEVDVMVVSTKDAVPDDVHGEALLTLPWGTKNLGDVLARGVRWVHVLGTGVDRFPLDALGDRVLTCSRGGSAVPIAEWVLATMLAFEKHLPDMWIREPVARPMPDALGTLAGKTLGLVGLGGIGLAVARRALAFDMRVRACRRTAAPSPMAGIEMAPSLRDLVASADHLVLAAPATAGTRHLLDAALLAAVKPGVHLVNVARGALVDEDALRTALDDGRVALASLDAVDPEPLPAGHWMYAHPRVRLSPHVSWSAPGALDELVDRFVTNLRRWCRGEALEGVVDPAAGY